MSDIVNFFSELKQTPFSYMVNPGNAGDAVIAAATFQLFESMKLPYDIPSPKRFDPNNRTLVFAGGGNLISGDSNFRRLLKEYWKKAKRVIILPHTIRKNEDLLSEFDERLTIICREEVSYKYVKNMAVKAEVLLMDDIAFNLDIEQFPLKSPALTPYTLLFDYSIQRIINMKHYPPLKGISRAIRHPSFIRKREAIFRKGKVLNCFRTDGERTGIAIPPDNIDLSEVFNYGTANVAVSNLATQHIFEFITPFELVRTNRLHIAIAAILLNKKVDLYGNNYYKIRAIYDYSIKGRYDNVTWKQNE